MFPIPRIQFTAFFSHRVRCSLGFCWYKTCPVRLVTINFFTAFYRSTSHCPYVLKCHIFPTYIQFISQNSQNFPMRTNCCNQLFKLDTVGDIRLYSISVYIPKISVKHDEKTCSKRLPPAREHHKTGPVLALLQQVLLREIQLLKQYAGGGVHRLHQRLPKPRKMGGFAMTVIRLDAWNMNQWWSMVIEASKTRKLQ